MPNNSEQARSSHSSCCICWPIARFSPREFPNDEIMANLKCAKYCKILVKLIPEPGFSYFFPPSLPFGKVCQTETRTGARESWGPLASGGIALDRQFSLIFSTKRPSGVWEIQKKWRFLAVTNHRTKWVSFSMVMLDYWRVAKIKKKSPWLPFRHLAMKNDPLK